MPQRTSMTTVLSVSAIGFALTLPLLAAPGCDRGLQTPTSEGGDGPGEQRAGDEAEGTTEETAEEMAAQPVAPGPTPRPTADPGENAQDQDPPAPDAPCGDTTCEAPATCVRYYGIAGPSGPSFESCEIRCKGPKDTRCPEGTRCVTVADGPGQVCR